MIVKSGREEIELNKDDRIMYNGKYYQIITRKCKRIAIQRARKLIKSGDLVYINTSVGAFTEVKCKFYKIKEADNERTFI